MLNYRLMSSVRQITVVLDAVPQRATRTARHGHVATLLENHIPTARPRCSPKAMLPNKPTPSKKAYLFHTFK
jgi:hypothetical protein